MQCNIDSKGKAARLIGGIITSVIALVLIALALFQVVPSWVLWVGIGTLAAGGFQIFEARAGWCVVRAMGIKTPI